MSETGDIIDRMVKKFTDEGKIIEAGWQAYRMLSIPPHAPEIQVKESRLAYFFGAQHLFASLVGVLDDGNEPTEAELQRLTLIANELNAFTDQVKKDAHA